VWFEPQDILATNDVWDRLLLRIDENGGNATALTTRAGVHGAFTVPKNFVGTAKIIVEWSATVTTNVTVFDFEYRAVGGSDAESLDQAGTQESLTITTGSGEPSAAWERMEDEFTLTSGNFAVDDIVSFFFARDGTDGADTKASATLIFGLYFQYADV
jgi:hypothetical protein